MITPHIGGFSPDALRVVVDFSCERIRTFFAERQLLNPTSSDSQTASSTPAFDHAFGVSGQRSVLSTDCRAQAARRSLRAGVARSRGSGRRRRVRLPDRNAGRCPVDQGARPREHAGGDVGGLSRRLRARSASPRTTTTSSAPSGCTSVSTSTRWPAPRRGRLQPPRSRRLPAVLASARLATRPLYIELSKTHDRAVKDWRRRLLRWPTPNAGLRA